MAMSPVMKNSSRQDDIAQALQGPGDESWGEIGPRIQQILMRESMNMKTYLAFYKYPFVNLLIKSETE